MRSDGATAADQDVDPLSRLELRPLYAYAYLLTGDRTRAASIARRAIAESIREPNDHRPALVIRARAARLAPRAHAQEEADEPIMRALAACGARERTVLVCSVHERLSPAEIAFIARCHPEEVDELRARAYTSARTALDQPAGITEASLPGMLRMGMLALADDLGEPPHADATSGSSRLRRRVGARVAVVALFVLAAGAAAWSTTRTHVAPGEEGLPQVFEQQRSGFRLTIDAAWRSMPTVATASAEGVDPKRFGLATLDPSDDTAVFIPQQAQQRPAMLRIAVAPSSSYDDDVASFRDQTAARQRSGAIVTAAPDPVAGRPATRFRIEHPDDDPGCPGCRSMAWVAHWVHGTTMTIDLTVFGPNDDLFEQGWGMVRSLQQADGTLRYLPSHGVFADGLELDEHLETLLQFLDARARGSGTEGWLADRLPADAGRPDGIAGYRVRLRITGRIEATFVVGIEVNDRFGGRSLAFDERISVGPGERLGVAWPSLIVGIDSP